MEPAPPRSRPGWVVFAVALLALNAVISVFAGAGHNLINLRYFQFPAQSPFKPLMLLNGALLLAILLTKRDAAPGMADTSLRFSRFWFAMALACLVIVAYLPALSINFWDHDWTHRHIGASVTSWNAVSRLFVLPQADGMYRPLAF